MKPQESNKITLTTIIYNTMFSGSQGKVIGKCEHCLFSQKLEKRTSWKGGETVTLYPCLRMQARLRRSSFHL